ncbi:MAG: Cytochrome c-type biogenesis protein CcsA/ResC [Hydrogenibacillus schlegelii]|uniref:Cytochrome c-type biogenesis protein CcsA/ResC n=2 Tax=Hydrogenibacillus schlegelii TaxID=1484 RepID=A0A2T5GEM4_HYDSH|nr:MAG: Cytochrome c-type biogenesis protein CcsA/ResC [Hydrogenibacillus schlegelii]
MTSMLQMASAALLVAFALYVVGTVLYFFSITGRMMRGAGGPVVHARRFGERGYLVVLVGWLFQLAFVVLRWIGSGHAPTSNMFEFMSFLAFSVVLAFLVVYRLYPIALLGLFTVPVAVVLIAYASVFSTQATPLIPALQSYWLYIHVTVAALGEGAFAVGFAAGLMYLLVAVRQDRRSLETALVETVLWAILSLVAFIVMTFAFRAAGHEVVFERVVPDTGMKETTVYTLPALIKPHGAEKVTPGGLEPLFETPAWMRGVNAGRKFNTFVLSLLGGTVLYGLLRLAARERLGKRIQVWLQGADLDLDLVDEISYRAIAIGFPIFTLGALVFAMIWAAEAWGRPWGWDPKETWAFITWLFYAAYLHLRLSVGWHGKKSAWLAVLGFVIVMTNLVVINLVLVGLHSYA